MRRKLSQVALFSKGDDGRTYLRRHLNQEPIIGAAMKLRRICYRIVGAFMQLIREMTYICCVDFGVSKKVPTKYDADSLSAVWLYNVRSYVLVF